MSYARALQLTCVGLHRNRLIPYKLVSEQDGIPTKVEIVRLMVAIMCACRYAGLTRMRVNHSMRKDYGLNPTLEHYTCVVDLLGQSGRPSTRSLKVH
ncbi:hypothetical protein F8388_024665 [Cannabis sativa]|uniref:Uncharacterized protein n=1 Tax=Cannabis sativa TaxID=3483 RepID=A0A7J6GC25_CANSA|nr:hypothetical protein F8388_024665 [Cannabis sativa]